MEDKDIKLAPYQERMLNELYELEERIEKAEKFLETDTEESKGLLLMPQVAAMKQYATLLRERCTVEGIITNLGNVYVPLDVASDKYMRKYLDSGLSYIKRLISSRERNIAITKLQEAIMWLGMDLKRLNETPNPYPESYNPNSSKIEPTADGLKM